MRIGANGQPSYGIYGSDARDESLVAHAIEVLTLDAGGRIAEILTYHEREAFARFRLPAVIAA